MPGCLAVLSVLSAPTPRARALAKLARLSLILALVAASSPVRATPPDGPSLDELRRQTSIEWESTVARTSLDRPAVNQLLRPYPAPLDGAQILARGLAGPIDAPAAEAQALDFLLAHAALFIDAETPVTLNADNLLLVETIPTLYPPEYQERGQDYTVIFQQYLRQFPVFEAQASVNLTQYGEIWEVTSTLEALRDVPAAPTLHAAAALERVRALLNDPSVEPEEAPALVVFAPSKLAWRMNVLKPYFEEMLIDAADGQVLLRRRNVVNACTVTMTVRDKDGLPLPQATGLYFNNATQSWSKTLDANGQATDASTPIGTGYCRAKIEGARARVRDADNDTANSIVQDTATFTTANNQTYTQALNLNVSTGVNTSEGGVAFREVMRAWNYVNTNYGFDRALATVYIDDDTGPSCSGNTLYFPHGRAVMDNGAPSAGARCDDTMLHEYGHAVQYGAYGGWGRPSGCTCSNHGGTSNDCSFDALVEGWAEYFPVMIYNHVNASDTHYEWSNSSSSHNVETNSTGATEERDEWTFAGALYDIYDTPTDTGDTLALGDDEIWTVMRNDKPKTVEQFFQMFITRYPQHAAALEQIYIAHNMHPAWLTLSTTQLSFGQLQTQLSFNIQRSGWYGDGVIVQPTWAITKDANWITSLSAASGSTTTETDTITVTISRAGLTAGTHSATLTVAPQYYGRARQIIVTCQAGVAPSAPTPFAPANGSLTVTFTPTLMASAFVPPNPGDTHASSQWQVDDNSDFSSPAYDRQETTTAKTQLTVPSGLLDPRGVYYWRVRYQTSSGLWSEWSVVWSFRVTCNGLGVDTEGDCDVDQLDLAAFLACLTQQGQPYPEPDCYRVDTDNDGDVDQSDFGLFQRCLGASTVPADPDCAQ